MMRGRLFWVRFISLIIVAFLPCFAWARQNSALKLSNDDDANIGWVIVDDDFVYEISTISLGNTIPEFCEDGSEAMFHYFEVIVRIQPDANVTGKCTLADQMKLGSDINKILSSHVSSPIYT